MRTLFIINCVNGKKIASHSFLKNEEEVILMPGSSFRITSAVNMVDGLHIIHVQQIKLRNKFLKPVVSRVLTFVKDLNARVTVRQ